MEIEDLSISEEKVEFLKERRERGTAPFPSARESGNASSLGREVLEEVRRRHGGSGQPESRQLCAVLEAIVEVIESEGLECTPAALYAASMSSLERPGTPDSPAVVTAICTLLSYVLPRCAPSILRLRMNESLKLFNRILDGSDDDHALQKAAATCLGCFLRAADPEEWTGSAQSFHHLLKLGVDGRPKARKRAVMAMSEALVGLKGTESGNAASEALFNTCCNILPAPAAAISAVSDARKKDIKGARDEAELATERALHLLGLLKVVLPALEASWSSRICQLIVGFYPLGQPLLTKHATDTLLSFLRNPDSALTVDLLNLVASTILSCAEAWDIRDADNVLSVAFLIVESLKLLGRMGPSVDDRLVGIAFQTFAPLLACEKEGVTIGVAECMRQLIQHAITDAMLDGETERAAGGDARGSTLGVVAEVMGSLLKVRYRTVWVHAFPLVGSFMEKLGTKSVAVAPSIILQLAEIYAVPDQRETLECAPQLQDALGRAVRAAGPERMDGLLPLNLLGALDAVSGRRGADVDSALEVGGGRAWLLEVYKKYIRCANLSFFANQWLPLARALERRALQARMTGRILEAKVALGLETQVWAVLAAFCHWAPDTSSSIHSIAKDLGTCLQTRSELRGIVCAALRQLIADNLRVARGTQEKSKDVETEDAEDTPSTVFPLFDDGSDPVPEFYTVELAKNNLEALSTYTRNFLPILFNLYVSLPPDKRGDVHATVKSFSLIADKKTLGTFFRTVLKKLVKVSQEGSSEEEPAFTEGGATVAERQCTFMELALALAGGMEESAAPVLYKACKPALMAGEVKVQKKGYKILAYLSSHHGAFCRENIVDILQMMDSALPLCNPASKLNRLHCMEGFLLILADYTSDALTADERAAAMSMLIGEICLCTKEVNAKTRSLAYELLVQLADGFPQETGGTRGFIDLVLAGLVGGTPHMQSATVMALARLMFEFPDELQDRGSQLLTTVLTLLRGRSREIVKSVLGFVKVAVGKMDEEDLLANLDAILEGLLIWGHDSKNRFKLKVKVILERLARKVGYAELENAMPEEHKKLLTNVRRTSERKERRRAGSVLGQSEADYETRSYMTRTSARSKARSRWAHTDFFGDDDSDDGLMSAPGTVRAQSIQDKSGKVHRNGPPVVQRKRSRQAISAELGDDDGDPVDLLGHGVARHLLQQGAKRRSVTQGSEEEEHEFKLAPDGRLVIKREWERDVHFASDVDDADDRSQGTRSQRSVRARTEGGRSRTRAGSMVSLSGRSARSTRTAPGKSVVHDAEKYRSKRSKGDVKGSKKFDPYAYWPMDRRMLNRRPSKRRDAKHGLRQLMNPSDNT